MDLTFQFQNLDPPLLDWREIEFDLLQREPPFSPVRASFVRPNPFQMFKNVRQTKMFVQKLIIQFLRHVDFSRIHWKTLEIIDSLIGPLLHLELNDLSQSQGSLIPFALVSHQFIRRPRIFALSTHTKFIIITIMMTHHYAKLNANIVTISLFWCRSVTCQ